MFSAQVEEGLELRLLELRHSEALFSLIDQNREHLERWFPWVQETKKVEDTESFIRSVLGGFAQGNGFQTGIWVDGELAGVIGLNYVSSEFHATELGYWLSADYEGRGVVTKVCRYLCTYLFEELELNRIEIRCSEKNSRSRKIPERLGFTLEGKLRQMGYTKDGLTDYLVYGLLKNEWQKEH